MILRKKGVEAFLGKAIETGNNPTLESFIPAMFSIVCELLPWIEQSNVEHSLYMYFADLYASGKVDQIRELLAGYKFEPEDLKFGTLMQKSIRQEALFFDAFEISFQSSIRFIEEYYVTLMVQLNLDTSESTVEKYFTFTQNLDQA